MLHTKDGTGYEYTARKSTVVFMKWRFQEQWGQESGQRYLACCQGYIYIDIGHLYKVVF